MTVIPVVHRNAEVRATIRRGLRRHRIRVVACRSLERVQNLIQRELVDGVVVDVRASGLADSAFSLAREFPRIPFFAMSAFRPDDGALLTACHQNPLIGILVEGVDDPAAGALIGPRLASRVRFSALKDAPRLLRLTEPLQVQTWDLVLERAGRPMTTADLAEVLRRTREHLSREFAAGGAPNLKRVIDLARAAWAADLLGNPGYTIRTVASILGYSSSSHLAGCARRIAGVPPRELGRIGPRGVLLRFVRGRTRSRL